MLKHYKTLRFFLIFCLSFSIAKVQARWATPDEAPVEFEIFNRDVTVHKDGTVEELCEQKIKILNEQGRDLCGTQHLSYNNDIQTIDILEAKTITDQGIEHRVPSHLLETKPLASSIQGFDQLSQILVAYPHVQVGSSVYLKYKKIIKKQPLPHYFATPFIFGLKGYWTHACVTLHSALPLYVQMNDPHQSLDVTQTKKPELQTLKITLKKPLYHELISENHHNQVAQEHITSVHVSTFKALEPIGAELSKDYERVLKESLPPLLESIKTSAESFADEVVQINTITSQLSEKMRYMGDWRSIQGKMIPRSFQDAVASGVGDCKDFAAMTAAILRALGHGASVALVTRGEGYLEPDKVWPDLGRFNHALVKVTSKKGRIFWIDPTNFASMADGLFPDIADRHALILNPQHASFEKIPSIDCHHALCSRESTIGFDAPEVLNIEGTLQLSGEQALHLTGAALSRSLKSIEETVIYNLSGELNSREKKFHSSDLTSRIVQDIKINYAYKQENGILLTNKGLGIQLTSRWVHPFLDTFEDQAGVLYTGGPSTVSKKLIFKDQTAENLSALNYHLDTPWLQAERECHMSDQGIEITERIVTLKSFISAQEIRSEQYKKLKDDIKKYCINSSVIFQSKM